MKITRKHLRKLILKEFRETGFYDDFDFEAGSGGGQLPPVKPPRRGGGGGGGEGPGDFSGRNNDPCDPGMEAYESSFDEVINTFQPWIQDNFSLGGELDFIDYYFKHLESLNIAVDYEDPFEYLKGLMDVIATYYCASRNLTNPPHLNNIYANPNKAIEYYWRQE